MTKRMILRILLVFGLILGIYLATPMVMRIGSVPQKSPRYTISQETTYFTEPLDADGHVDYIAAVNRHFQKQVQPEQNIVAALVPILGPQPDKQQLSPKFYEWLGVPQPGMDGKYLKSIDEYDPVLFKTTADNTTDRFAHLAKYPWKKEDYPELEEWLNYHDPLMPLIFEATERNQYYHPLTHQLDSSEFPMMVNTLLSIAVKCREVAKQLNIHAMLQLQQNQPLQAWKSIYSLHRLGRTIANGHGSFIEYLVGLSIIKMANQSTVVLLDYAKLSRQQVNDIREKILALPKIPIIQKQLNIEVRSLLLETAIFVSRGWSDQPLMPNPMFKLKDLEMLGWEDADRFDWNQILLHINKNISDMIEIVSMKTYQLRLQSKEEFVKKLKQAKFENIKANKSFTRHFRFLENRSEISQNLGDVLLSLYIPAFNNIQDATENAIQEEQNLHTALALQFYNIDHDEYPDRLDQIVPQYLAEVPMDYYRNQPLQYQKTQQGYLLYSFGKNQRDDGGNNRNDDKRIGDKSDDIRIRIPVEVFLPIDEIDE